MKSSRGVPFQFIHVPQEGSQTRLNSPNHCPLFLQQHNRRLTINPTSQHQPITNNAVWKEGHGSWENPPLAQLTIHIEVRIRDQKDLVCILDPCSSFGLIDVEAQIHQGSGLSQIVQFEGAVAKFWSHWLDAITPLLSLCGQCEFLLTGTSTD